jgi:hypothetical protein
VGAEGGVGCPAGAVCPGGDCAEDALLWDDEEESVFCAQLWTQMAAKSKPYFTRNGMFPLSNT